jgi:hypothetical protein
LPAQHLFLSLIRGDRTLARPGAQRRHLLGHHHRQRPRALHFVFDAGRSERLLLRLRLVERGDDRLLDLRAGKAVAGAGQPADIERRRILLLARQLDAQDLLARGAAGKIDEEYLVEAPLA